MRKLILASLLVFAAGCATPAGTPSPVNTTSPAETRADTQLIRIGLATTYPYLTPQASALNNYVIQPMYDNLTQFGAKYEVKPAAAEKWSISADSLKWTFNLRPGLAFSNGDPLTADDVKFTFDKANTGNWPVKAYFPNVTDVSVVDPQTVVFTTRVPDMSVPNGGPFLLIVPKKYYEGLGDEGFRAKPIGSGPYELTAYTANDSVRYKKRSTAHAYRKPANDELLLRFIPENAQRVNGLTTGELDMVASSGFSGDQADQLKRQGFNVIGKPDTGINLMIPQGTFESRNTPLAKVEVRQALNYAVNRQQLADAVFKGYALPLGQLAVPDSQFWNDSIPAWPYDQTKAKQLLAQAGYPNGFALKIGWNPASGPQEIVLQVQSDLKAAGLDAEIVTYESTVISDLVFGRNNAVKDDLFVFTAGDANGLAQYSLFGCNKPVGGQASANFYCVQEYERIYNQMLTEQEPAKRVALLKEANLILTRHVPALFLFARPNFIVGSTKVRDITLPVPNHYNFDSVYLIK